MAEIPDFQGVSNRAESVTTSSAPIANQIPRGIKRTQIYVTNISATTVTIAKGNLAAVANQGILLAQNQTWYEATDSGFTCWQGAIQAIGSGASTLSVVETVESAE